MPTTKAKGDLLERIVSQLCAGIHDAKVESNVQLIGKSGISRQLDTLITGKLGIFEARILVDSKNHASPVDINAVESMVGMVADVGANLGAIVCPAGFTEGAKRRAQSGGVQLYEIFDPALGNSPSLIPLRFIEARISKYSFQISSSSAAGKFSMPGDKSRWIFNINGKAYRPEDVPTFIWNEELVPQEAGEYEVAIGAVKITDTQDKNQIQYCDLKVRVIVVEDYYLKLFPASFMRRAGDGKEHFDLKVDIHSNREKMLANGWTYCESVEEMNRAADIENQPQGVRDLIMRNIYSIEPVSTE